MTDISELQHLLKTHGLIIGGVLNHDEIRQLEIGKLLAGDEEDNTRQLILIGNGGSEIWRSFVSSQEYLDTLDNPMDRWSRCIGEDLARRLNGRAIFPWEGPPYAPFLDWASKAGQVFPSPVSMFIHWEYGLWHAWRFALALSLPLSGYLPLSRELSPCEGCPQPCLDACPVEAFSGAGYRVHDCVDYLQSDQKSACRETGCAARHACPVGSAYRYEAEHAQFHMAAFLKSRLR